VRDRVEAIVQDRSGKWLAFGDPARIVAADSVSGVRAALADVERLTRDACLHAVGFVTYEAGAAFGLHVPAPSDSPLVWFALFEAHHVRPIDRPAAEDDYRLGPMSPSLGLPEFQAAFDRIKAHLAAGDTYQVNFTFKMTGHFDGDALAFFADLVDAQRGAHSAFIRMGDRAICSASPELFFELDGVQVRARPMKGTSRRGRTLAEDRKNRDNLHQSAKQRAENVMIVDMMRNDLGRVAEVGSVGVPELFTVERYPNVWQMTSLVTARSMASLEDLFAAMHPCASVTGAPKARTMHILSELEGAPRGVYTGAIGHVPPDGNASFNVAIRTAVVDERAKTIEFGIGSGIVWDSDAAAEYEECLLKGSVIGRRPVHFELLETLRWTPEDGYFLIDRHLERMRDSAEYFDFVFRKDSVLAALSSEVSGAPEPLRVRLLLAPDGAVRLEHAPLSTHREPLRVTIASEPIDSDDVWLYHKTTRRQVYDRARTGADGFDEVILWNPHRQVTEATTANLIVEIGGVRLTPPIECGLLAGTYRAELLARGEIHERVVTLDDLQLASRLWLINSVHESREAVLR
jgi:para-aminobenzoate synthetase / 4-amino-4-deoxychorismate lyase